MSIISYAQNFEDVMLWRALKHIEKGFYIDIGAAWPVYDSVTKLFYEHGWSGINVEPNVSLYCELVKDRTNDINLNVGISKDKGEFDFFIVGETGLSSANKELSEKLANQGMSVSSIKTNFMTLNDVWDQYVKQAEVHFLKIDVEGLETSIIQSNDWSKHRPWILVVEATLPSSQIPSYIDWESMLFNADYLFAYQDGLNRFYVASEHSELLATFSFPPNVFDGFIKFECNADIIKENQSLKEEVNDLKKLLNDVIASHSWKLTEPLRNTMRFISRFSKKLRDTTRD